MLFIINDMKQNNYVLLFKVFLLAGLYFLSASGTFSQTNDQKLAELRTRFAVNYLKPEAHFALAKYYLDKNDKTQAFLILEYARRYRFDEKDFNASYEKFFGNHSAEPSDEAKSAFEKASRLQTEGKFDEAEPLFVKAAELSPESAFIQTWVGRFYYRTKPDTAKALQFYFNAYFLDPNAYDTEYAESRIHNIAAADADAKFKELLNSGKSLPEIAADPNPIIAGKAVVKMSAQWKKEYVEPLLKCLESDDSILRWAAFSTIIVNADGSTNALIKSLSTDSDLRKRGLALYALVEFQKNKSFPTIRKMLKEKADLIRFDAVSALFQAGGQAGRAILLEHQKVEPNPLLKKLISQELTSK